VNNTVLFYQATHDKLIAEFPKYKRFWVTSLTQIFFLLLLADEL
jgi:hypothetical protein